MSKNKKDYHLIFLGFFMASLLLGANYALALELKYPPIPGLPSINSARVDIADYVSYFFGILIYVAGLLALISFTLGAIGLINPNVEAHKNAKDRMKGAVLGLVLTVASFIVIQTINPTLETPTLTPLQKLAGVYYTNGKEVNGVKEEKQVGEPVPDVAKRGDDLIKNGFNNIIYDCGSGDTGPALLIWEFPNAGLEDGNGDLSAVKVVRKNCGQEEEIDKLGSFNFSFEKPGIYYCLGGCGGDDMCKGYMSTENTPIQPSIKPPFSDRILGVRIVNDSKNNLYYGAIFHEKLDLSEGGSCSVPELNRGSDSSCHQLEKGSYLGVNIFNLNKTAETSGNGVTFYGKPWGFFSGAAGGSYTVPNKDAPFVWNDTTVVDSAKMTLDYTSGPARFNPDLYKQMCVTFQDCPGTINIDGTYLVAVYGKDASTGYRTSYCTTYTSSLTNGRLSQILGNGDTIGDVFIIPTVPEKK